MVSTNYNYRVPVYTEPVTTAPEVQTPAGEVATELTTEEILATVFTKMLNDAVAADPEWADLSQRLNAQGKNSLEIDLEDFGIDFNELAANNAPDVFVPASLLKAQQELADLVLDTAKVAMGETLSKADMQKIAGIESAPWQEAVIQYAFSMNPAAIDTKPAEKPTAPLSKDIHREVKSQAPLLGTFSVSSMLTTAQAKPAEKKITSTPKAPPPVNLANYKSASLHSQFAATHAAAKAPAPKSESADAIEAKTGVLNLGMARAVSAKFSSFLATCAADGIPTNVYDIVQWVLRQAYMEGIEDLVYRRDKVMLANKAKEALRKEAAAARAEKTRINAEAAAYVKDLVTNYPAMREAKKKELEAEAEKKYPWYKYPLSKKTKRNNYVNDNLEAWEKTHKPTPENITKNLDSKKDELTSVGKYVLDMNQNPPKMIKSGKKCSSMAELDDYIKELENKMSSIGDDAQLSNVDLQTVLEKQQELIKTLSNLGKLLHDTALAIIRKIG